MSNNIEERARLRAREIFMKAFIRALADLRVLTPGLVRVASTAAVQSLIEAMGIEEKSKRKPLDALRELLSILGIDAEVLGNDEIHVSVKPPCPLSFCSECRRLCPLPHLSAAYLSVTSERRWSPRRFGKDFIEIDDRCRFRLV